MSRRINQGKRRHRDDPLAAQPQPLPTGHQHPHVGAVVDEPGNVGCHVRHMLEIVQQEQHLLPLQVGRQRVRKFLARYLAHG